MNIVSDVFQHPVFGRTVEVNILGEIKVCTFDCTYCSRGPSQIRISRLKHDAQFTSIEDVLKAVGQTLGANSQPASSIETLLIAGNGEPTLHPLFAQFTKALIERRDEMGAAKTKIICLTNGDQLADRNVIEALNLFDECIVRIDAGTEKAFKKINRPLSRSSLEKVILGARDLKNLSVQTVVTGGDFSLTQPTYLDEWIEVVAMLAPKKLYLTKAQAPCADPKLKFATDDEIHRIAHWLERRLKIKAQVEIGFAA